MNGRAVFFMVVVLAMCCAGTSVQACVICSGSQCVSAAEGYSLCGVIQGQCYTSSRYCGPNGDVHEIERVVRFPRGKGAGAITIRAPRDLTREDALFVTKSLYLLTVNALIHR